MRRPTYTAAIAWIAENDSAGDNDAHSHDVVGRYVTSVLVADLFDVSTDKVGMDVVNYRKEHQ